MGEALNIMVEYDILFKIIFFIL